MPNVKRQVYVHHIRTHYLHRTGEMRVHSERSANEVLARENASLLPGEWAEVVSSIPREAWIITL